MSAKNVLVTGGSGFGGSYLVSRLIERGDRVWNFDLVAPTPARMALLPAVAAATYVHGDCRNLELLATLLHKNGIDEVFHLAAQPIVPLSIVLPFETLVNNAVGAYSVLEAVRLVPVGATVVASSGAYYGTTTQPGLISESAPPLPASNLYAPGKVAADLAAQSYAMTFGLPIGVCRFMNTYGPGDDNTSRLVPRALELLLAGGAYDFGDRDDGSTRLDFLHVSDMTSAYLRVADHVREVGGTDAVFNIGTGVGTETREIVSMMSRLFDGREREPIFRGPRRAVRVEKVLDVSKARDVLRWEASLTTACGLQTLFDWANTSDF